MKVDVVPILVATLGVSVCMSVGAYQWGAENASHSSLDKAQEAFSKNDDRARGYNWPVFKQANSVAKLHCSDTPDGSLRVCAIRFPAIDPATGDASGTFDEPFACTKTACSWVRF